MQDWYADTKSYQASYKPEPPTVAWFVYSGIADRSHSKRSPPWEESHLEQLR